jgi:hypothetical protein
LGKRRPKNNHRESAPRAEKNTITYIKPNLFITMEQIKIFFLMGSRTQHSMEESETPKSPKRARSKSPKSKTANKELSSVESGDFSERNLLKIKAKQYGIKANLSTDDLRTSVGLFESGRPEQIPPSHIKKGNEGNFLMSHKKAVGISSGTILLLFLLFFFLGHRTPEIAFNSSSY